jgi:hypothetical protein
MSDNDRMMAKWASRDPGALESYLGELAQRIEDLRAAALAAPRGGVRPDSWIREQAAAGMIEPFEAGQG